MLKYLTVVLLAFLPALPALGAAPSSAHGANAPSPATRQAASRHAPTAAQRKARLERLAHQRAVKRIAEEQRLSRRSVKRSAKKRRVTVAHRRVRRRVVRRHATKRETLARRRVVRRAAVHRAYEHRVAAHRAYERRLAHERWLRRHRAYEARLRRRREARRRAVGRRAEPARVGKARSASDHSAGTEVAKVEVPNGGPLPLTGTVRGTALDYVSHEHVHLYWRSPLRGTHASLARQDERDRAEGLTRIENEQQLRDLVRTHDLIPLPLNEGLQVDPRLAHDRRYTRPWTAEFLRDLSRAYMHRFGEALVITSAVRPATYQRRLTWRNGNAAPANGAIASPHEFGATIDIGKKGMTARQKAWMRGYLFPVQKAGQIDVEEEFHQACFHVTVYKTYVPAPMARPEPEMADGQMDADAR